MILSSSFPLTLSFTCNHYAWEIIEFYESQPILLYQSIGAVVSMLATSSPAPGSIPGGDRVFRALTDHTVPSDQDLK